MCEKQHYEEDRTSYVHINEKEIPRMLPELARHIVVQKNRWEDEEEATRAASCASASLQRVKESRWLHRQERKNAMSVQKDRKYQADNRVGKTGARGGKCGEVRLVSRPISFFWRNTQCYYCPQGSGRRAGGTAGD